MSRSWSWAERMWGLNRAPQTTQWVHSGAAAAATGGSRAADPGREHERVGAVAAESVGERAVPLGSQHLRHLSRWISSGGETPRRAHRGPALCRGRLKTVAADHIHRMATPIQQGRGADDSFKL